MLFPRFTLLLAFGLTLAYHSYGQDSCTVLVEELAGSYTGDCANGWAQGKGEATGPNQHQYQGYWVQGFPEGVGQYTWPSGDRYQGEWVHGRREGEGTMYFANGTEKTGVWENDEYIGTFAQAVEVLSNSAAIEYSIFQQGVTKSKISIQFYWEDQPYYPTDLRLASNTGIRFEGPNITGWERVTFPMEFTVQFTQPASENESGTPVNFQARIEKPGDWWLILGRK